MESHERIKEDERSHFMETLFEKIVSKIDYEIVQLNEKLRRVEETLETRIDTLERKLFKALKLDDEDDIFVELRKEMIQIDKEEVIRNLKFNDARSIVNLFRKYYYKKENRIHKYPIKFKGKRNYQDRKSVV